MSEPITAEDYSRKPEEGSYRFLIEPKKQGTSRLIALAGMFGVILLARIASALVFQNKMGSMES